MTDLPGSYLIVFHTDGTAYQARLSDRDVILLAWQGWVKDQQDALVSFRALSGADCIIRASCIDTVTTSTPDARLRAQNFQHALAEEESANWRHLGVFDEPENW